MIRTLAALVRTGRPPWARVAASVALGFDHGAVRRGPDGGRRVPHLKGCGAPADPVPHGRHRGGPGVRHRSTRRSVPRTSRLPRPGLPGAHPDAGRLLPRTRASGAGAVRGRAPGRRPGPAGGRHRRDGGPVPARALPALGRRRRRGRVGRGRRRPPPGRGGRPGQRAGGRRDRDPRRGADRRAAGGRSGHHRPRRAVRRARRAPARRAGAGGLRCGRRKARSCPAAGRGTGRPGRAGRLRGRAAPRRRHRGVGPDDGRRPRR